MTHLERIAARIAGQPLLIMPQKLGVIAHVLAGRIGIDVEAPELGLESADRPEPLASRFVGQSNDPNPRNKPKYMVTDAGTAIITITGSLANRGAWIGANSGLTSYEGIAAQIRDAMADPRVTELLYDISSPGGEATGAFELADFIRTASATKPSTAFVNGLAASAGYMIASGAKRIVSIPSGLTGSIGVVMMHADYSRMLANVGITPTFVFSGAHKVDANPYEPLDAGVKASLQAEVDRMREAFARTVELGRGARLTAEAALATEAAIFTGAEAKQIGLVDDLATFDALYEDMNRAASARKSNAARPGARRPATMSTPTQADLDAARAEGHAAGKAEGHAAGLAQGREQGREDGLKAGATAERARVKAIVEHPEAKGREGLAAHYAYNTEDSVEAAAAALKASAKGSNLSDRAAEGERGFHAADTGAKKTPVIDAAGIYDRLNAKR